MAFAGSPDNCLSNTPNNFPKFSFVSAQELKMPKMAIFRRCLKIVGKAENGGKFIGAEPKKYYIEVTEYFFALHRRYIIAEHLTHWVLQFVTSEAEGRASFR